MGKFVGVVYDPPGAGFPHLAVMFNEKDMSKPIMAEPVSSIAHGEAMIAEVSKRFLEEARKADGA